VVVVRCPLCGAWISGNEYDLHLSNVHPRATQRGPVARRRPPGGEAASRCTHLPHEGSESHWLADGEQCLTSLASQFEAAKAFVEELRELHADGLEAVIGVEVI